MMIYKKTVRFTGLLVLVGLLFASHSFSAMPERLQDALRLCPKWIKLSPENIHFIWDLPNEKRSFLLQLDSSCYPGYLETRQLEILKEWVAKGNILWILFNPLRAEVPGNQDWASYFGVEAHVSTQAALVTKKEGLILPVRGLTDGVEVLQYGTPNITPAFYSFSGGLIPVLTTKEGRAVFGGQNFGAGRIIFDGFGWLFFEAEKDMLDPLVYDNEVFWVNFFKWARTCVPPMPQKEEKLGMWVPAPVPVLPAPIKKEKIDCSELSQRIKDKFPNLKIKVLERSNGDCVFDLDRVLFDTGKADLREEGRIVLDEIVNILKENAHYQVKIEGHTDSMPIRGRLKKKFPTNWELARARSETVYRFFLEGGHVSLGRMAKAWFGDTRPVASNKTQDGRQQNRRTEIILFVNRTLEK